MLRRTGAALFAFAWLESACDVPDYGFSDAGVPLRGDAGLAPLELVGNSVSDRILGEGEALEFSFNRYLKPSTAIRQSFAVRDAFSQGVQAPLVQYDPVTRIVRIENPEPRPSDWLLPDQPYTLILGVPELGVDLGGFRAIDEATLPRGRVFGFQTRGASRASEPIAPDFCGTVLPTLRDKCATCHGVQDALDLSSSAGIQRAIGSIARGSVRGAGGTVSPGKHFGEDMALIEPGNPASSYLLYKVLLSPSGTRASAHCGTPLELPAPTIAYTQDVSGSERTTLHTFIAGDPMPPVRENALTFDERRALSHWIQSGARISDCACK